MTREPERASLRSGNPYDGNTDKRTPHLALRASFPPRGSSNELKTGRGTALACASTVKNSYRPTTPASSFRKHACLRVKGPLRPAMTAGADDLIVEIEEG
jgi:hypothetical protein